jgi:hypothetical protein
VATQSDIPPTRTVQPIDPAPASTSLTTAMLKADIDSGRTGDKVEVFDPGLSPLRTDDEAAGTPASTFRVALARFTESAVRWRAGYTRGSAVRNKLDGLPVVYVSFIVAVGLALVIGIAVLA